MNIHQHITTINQLIRDQFPHLSGAASQSCTQIHTARLCLSLDIEIPKSGFTDEHRSDLNRLCNALAAAGYRSALDVPGHFNSLTTGGEDGEPWMLFNGGKEALIAPYL